MNLQPLTPETKSDPPDIGSVYDESEALRDKQREKKAADAQATRVALAPVKFLNGAFFSVSMKVGKIILVIVSAVETLSHMRHSFTGAFV